MSGNTTEKRKIKTITDIFTPKNRIIDNIDILNLFERTLKPTMSWREFTYTQKFVRVGDTHKPLNLSINTYGDARERGSIYKIQLPVFVSDVLKEIDNYRRISKNRVDGLYKIIEKFPGGPGTYLLTYDNEPQFKIEIMPSEWAIRTMTFEQCEGVSTFKYLPDLDSRPRKVTIETCVAQRAKGDTEKLVKKLFRNFHEQLKQAHIKLGMTSAKK